MELFTDLDDVWVDFIGAACRAHGLDFNEVNRQRSSNRVWALQEILGLNDEEFWRPIRSIGAAFWETIPCLPWFDELLEAFAPYEWSVVTAPSTSDRIETVGGKLAWAQKNMPTHIDRFFVKNDKTFFAKIPGAVLIDDREENVNKFVAAGGRGILFPVHGNRVEEHLRDPVAYIRRELSRLEVEDTLCIEVPDSFFEVTRFIL